MLPEYLYKSQLGEYPIVVDPDVLALLDCPADDLLDPPPYILGQLPLLADPLRNLADVLPVVYLDVVLGVEHLEVQAQDGGLTGGLACGFVGDVLGPVYAGRVPSLFYYVGEFALLAALAEALYLLVSVSHVGPFGGLAVFCCAGLEGALRHV